MAPAFARILLAYDDSEASRIALQYACALTAGDATLTVAHAVDENSIVASAVTTGFAPFNPAPLIGAIEGQGSAVLNAALTACATHGVEAERVFIHDSAHSGIVGLQQARGIDLIVVGTHGRRGVSRVMLGSVTEDILRASRAPVLVVNGNAPSPRRESVFARALVALDDSEPSRTAMVVATRLTRTLGTQLTLCNVIDTRRKPARMSHGDEDGRSLSVHEQMASLRLLQTAADANGSAVRTSDLVALTGEPAVAIQHAATQRNCDLVIVGSHVRRGLERLLLGSVAEAVLRASTIPVLVVPPR